MSILSNGEKSENYANVYQWWMGWTKYDVSTQENISKIERLLKHNVTWLNFKIVMLSEEARHKGNTYGNIYDMIAFIWKIHIKIAKFVNF